MQDGVIGSIVEDIKAAGVDHLAVTGDLVNLALDGEIELARLWLETLGPAADVSVVPGNHDAYVPGAFDKVCRVWGAWMTGDGQNAPADRHAFPYMRVRGKVALIGASSARATAPFMANGFFREDQAHRLGALLDKAAKQGLFRVVMIHHPPVRNAVAQHKRLFGISNFQKTIARHGAELVLHGHSHEPTLYWIGAKGKQTVPVVGVAAGGQATGGSHPAAQWNLLEISGEPEAWALRLIRRGLSGPTLPVGELSRTDLIGEPGAATAIAAGHVR
jgi:3',5'-cyclic AMP phosphodiesterase CpdA